MPNVIVYANAMRQIIRAGMASTYAEAHERYGSRLTRVKANTVTVASLNKILEGR
jgi:hypothetical protein